MSVWVISSDETLGADKRWFEFDWSSFLASGETITSYSVTCDANMTKLSDSSTPTSVLIQVTPVSGAGTQSLITCRIDTSYNNVQENQYTTQKYVSIRARQS